MRDKLKDIDFFNKVVSERESSEKRRIKKIKQGLIAPDRIQSVKVDMAKNQLYLLISKYSGGWDVADLMPNYLESISYFSESWVGYWKLKDNTGHVYNQYILSAYDEVLWILSLGFLLGVSEDEFNKVVHVIDSDKIKDSLFEAIIRGKLPNREPISVESYKEHLAIPKIFKKLRCALSESDKMKSQVLIAEFLNKDWYNKHSEAGWYNTHMSKHPIYSGYWCFESAAVTCIMGLDDSSYRDQQYYPKDLADYYRSNH